MKTELTMRKVYQLADNIGNDLIKVNVELHDGYDTDYIVDITLTSHEELELDEIYATAEVDESELSKTVDEATKMAEDLFKTLNRKYANVVLNNWAK